MRQVFWILGIALVCLLACGVEQRPIDTSEAATLQATALTEAAQTSELAAEPDEILSCFSICLADCLESMGCNSLPPEQQQDCGFQCGEGCRCQCGPPSACP